MLSPSTFASPSRITHQQIFYYKPKWFQKFGTEAPFYRIHASLEINYFAFYIFKTKGQDFNVYCKELLFFMTYSQFILFFEVHEHKDNFVH